MTEKHKLAYLGPEGTFSDIVSRDLYGSTHILTPLPTIDDIFSYILKDASNKGLVPIENSSGGVIHSTVDRLIEAKETLVITRELSLRVNLALCGHKEAEPLRVYSHFAPLHHCEKWVKKNLPSAERIAVDSTALAAQKAAEDPSASALCPRKAAELYGLDVLQYPVEQDIENVTQFYYIEHLSSNPSMSGDKTTLVATLPNTPGALVDFLLPFKEKGINLTRILSRPIPGKPQEYIFFVDVAGSSENAPVQDVLDHLNRHNLCTELTLLGSYPVAPRMDS